MTIEGKHLNAAENASMLELTISDLSKIHCIIIYNRLFDGPFPQRKTKNIGQAYLLDKKYS